MKQDSKNCHFKPLMHRCQSQAPSKIPQTVLEKNGIKINRIIFFGSYASGKQRETSDIDLVVISDDFLNKDYWQRIELLTDAIYEVFKPIEAVAMTVKEWEKGESIIADFARDGEVVFAA